MIVRPMTIGSATSANCVAAARLRHGDGRLVDDHLGGCAARADREVGGVADERHEDGTFRPGSTSTSRTTVVHAVIAMPIAASGIVTYMPMRSLRLRRVVLGSEDIAVAPFVSVVGITMIDNNEYRYGMDAAARCQPHRRRCGIRTPLVASQAARRCAHGEHRPTGHPEMFTLDVSAPPTQRGREE